MEFIVTLHNVKKAFGKKTVLNGLSLRIPRGKISFIIGRSGEGKSVTIKHIVGILHPDSGEIVVDKAPMHRASSDTWEEVRKKIGILFQDGALFDSLTVFENVSFPIINHTKLSYGAVKERVAELLALVDLSGFEDKFPAELSIGERKRIGLARALAIRPKILLYDEPTTGMDPLVSDLIDKLIVTTQQSHPQDITSIVISHDIASVMHIADYIFLLHEGRVYFEGTVQDFQQTSDPLVQQFLTGSRDGPLNVPLV